MQSIGQRTCRAQQPWPLVTGRCQFVDAIYDRARLVARRHDKRALRSRLRYFAAYENSRLCSQLFRDCLSSTCLDWKATSMPLLKPPKPQVAMRKFFIRIEEPLARTMERYAEFLGTDNLNHVVAQALQFVFNRDSQFKSWLEQNPDAAHRLLSSKARSKTPNNNGDGQ